MYEIKCIVDGTPFNCSSLLSACVQLWPLARSTACEQTGAWTVQLPGVIMHGAAHVSMCVFGSQLPVHRQSDHKQLNIYTCTCTCSQNPRKYVSHTRGHVYSACECKYYARSYARACIASRSTIRIHTGLIDHHMCARLLALTRVHSYTTREYSYATREYCIDRSWALTPPSRVKCKRALSCLWSVLYIRAHVYLVDSS